MLGARIAFCVCRKSADPKGIRISKQECLTLGLGNVISTPARLFRVRVRCLEHKNNSLSD